MQRNIEIVPAILEKSLADIEEKLQTVRGAARLVQIDIVDGVFAPNTTWPYGNDHARKEFENIVAQAQALPLWEDFDFQFDLMMHDPEEQIEKYISAGASSIVVHAKSPKALEALQKIQDKRGGDFPVALGVALLPADTVAAFDSFKGLIDFVQVMGIAKPGFQGENFDPQALTCIRAVREKFEGTIQVDGSVNASDIQELAEAGATRLIIGSAIFTSENPKEEMKELSRFANRI